MPSTLSNNIRDDAMDVGMTDTTTSNATIVSASGHKAAAKIDGVKNAEDVSGSPFFENLPREIRDEIYKLAYVDGEEEVTVSDIYTWTTVERQRRISNYNDRINSGLGAAISPLPSARAFLLSPFPKMTANRQFYCEATEVWASAKTISVLNWEHFASTMGKCPGLKSKIINLKLPGLWWYFCDGLATLTGLDSLRSLQIVVNDSLFIQWNTYKISCVHEYSDLELSSVIQLRRVPYLPSLRSITLEPQDSMLVEDEAEEATWHRNVAHFEKILMAKLKERQYHGPSAEIDVLCDTDGWRASRFEEDETNSCKDSWGGNIHHSFFGDGIRSNSCFQGWSIPSDDEWASSVDSAVETPTATSKTCAERSPDAQKSPAAIKWWQQSWIKNMVGVTIVAVSVQAVQGLLASYRADHVHVASTGLGISMCMGSIVAISWLAWGDLGHAVSATGTQSEASNVDNSQAEWAPSSYLGNRKFNNRKTFKTLNEIEAHW